MSANVAHIVVGKGEFRVGRGEFRVDSLPRRVGGGVVKPSRPSESHSTSSSPPFLDSHVLRIFTLRPAPPSQITVSVSNIFAYRVLYNIFVHFRSIPYFTLICHP